MGWEERLKELNGYNVSFEIKQGYYHFSLVYDEGWDILMPDNENIYVEKRNGIYHYIASIDSTTIDDMFTAIEATIDYNMDLQRKLILFKQKTDELREIFSTEDYDTLKKLRFTFEKKHEKKTVKKTETEKEKPKKKTTRKKKETPTKELEEVKDKITQVETNDYDQEEEVVTMSGEYLQELERK